MKCTLRDRYQLECGKCEGNKLCRCFDEDGVDDYMERMTVRVGSNKEKDLNSYVAEQVRRMEKLQTLF